MKKLTGFLSLLLLTFSLGSISIVRAQDPNLDWQMYNQQQRIREGVYSGRLSPEEARRLEERQRRIRAQLQESQYNGNYSPYERERLRQELRDISIRIHQKKSGNGYYRNRRYDNYWQRRYQQEPKVELTGMDAFPYRIKHKEHEDLNDLNLRAFLCSSR